MKKSAILEIIAAILVTFCAVWFFEKLRLSGGLVKQIGILGIPVFLIYSPFLFAKISRSNPDNFGITLDGAKRSILFAVKTSVVVLPIFTIAYFLYKGIFLHKEMNIHFNKPFFSVAIWNFVGIAFPEEVFFRGYLQTRLKEFTSAEIRLFKTRLSVAAVLASALFAIAHLLTSFDASRLAVFLPSCLFGWVRDRTESILGPAVLHWLCNTLLFLLCGFY